MLRFVAALLALCGFVACANSCAKRGPNDPSSADTQARAIARGTVETLETVWMTAGKMCIAAAEDQNTMNDCKRYLEPAREAIVEAIDAVDVWDAAAQQNFPCLIVAAVDGINQGLGIATQAGLVPPQVIKDGLILASIYAPQCVKDGGNG